MIHYGAISLLMSSRIAYNPCTKYLTFHRKTAESDAKFARQFRPVVFVVYSSLIITYR